MEFTRISALVLCLTIYCLAADNDDVCHYVKLTRTQGFEVGKASFVNSQIKSKKAIVKEICLILNGEPCFPNDLFTPDSQEAVNFKDAGVVPTELDRKSRKKRSARGEAANERAERDRERAESLKPRNSGGTMVDHEEYYAQVKSISCKSGKCNHRNVCDLGEARGHKASIDVGKINSAKGSNSGMSSRMFPVHIFALGIYHIALNV